MEEGEREKGPEYKLSYKRQTDYAGAYLRHETALLSRLQLWLGLSPE